MKGLYRKVNKTKENPSGMIELTGDENPFLKPCLLCLSAQTRVDRSVFGVAKVGASLARVRVKNFYNAGYDIDSMPVNFLASRMSEQLEDVNNFVDTYFVPLLEINGNRVDVKTACQHFRNINILTYCDGTTKALQIENVLKDRLCKLGYTKDETQLILGNIFLLAISTDKINGYSSLNTFAFRDVLDSEVSSKLDHSFVETNSDEMLLDVSSKCQYYLYKGNGDHTLKKYAYYDRVRTYISLILTSALENSIGNANRYLPLDFTLAINTILQAMKNNYSEEKMLVLVDSNISYSGASKLSLEEAILRDELDEAYIKQIAFSREIETLKVAYENNSKQIENIIRSIKANCSDTNYLRILVEACGWQASSKDLENIANTPNDRDLLNGNENRLVIGK